MQGTLRKMTSELNDVVEYSLPVGDQSAKVKSTA